MDKPNVDSPQHGKKSLFAPTTSGSNGGSRKGRGSSSSPNSVSGSGMDRKVKKKTWTPQRIAMGVGVLIFFGIIAYGLSTTTGGRKLNVDKEKITIAAVSQGEFQEFISQTGNVMPRVTHYLDAEQGGRIEEIFVLEGAMVEAGDPLLRLSNDNLQLSVFTAETNRIEQVNRLEQMRFQIEQNNLSMRQQLADMEYNVQRVQRDFDRNQELFDKQLISTAEYERTKDEFDWYMNRLEMTRASYVQDSLRQALQLEAMMGSVERMDENFEVVEDQIEKLTLRAPVTGQLSALDAELGEMQSSGFRFGQIDVMDGNKVRAGIDEFYITRVSRGQRATTQPINGVEYPMLITRVYPEVRDGRFEVDMEFVGQEPAEIRRGQTIRFRLELGDPAEGILLPRGGFYQTTGGNWVYVVDPSGEFAERRSIRLGRQNPQFFEVLEGLQPGEQVVTSSYETFGDNVDRLVF